MRIESHVLEKTIRDGILALDASLIELCARAADAEAERLEAAADLELGAQCRELRVGAQAARRIAVAIRGLE